MASLLFTYGTLRRDSTHPMRRILARHATWLDQARFAGLLYDVGTYPAAVPDPAGQHWVWGDLFRMHDPGVAFTVLDEYEGCGKGDPVPEYRRGVFDVEANFLGARQAWVYVYNLPVADLSRVHSGDYEYRPGTSREGAELDR